jgi:hypothetical protein
LQAGPRFKAIEEDLISVVAKAGVAKDEVFFGPALEFAYAAFGFTPPKGLPVWWHPGTSYSPRDNATIATRFRSNLPKLVVFLLYYWPAGKTLGQSKTGRECAGAGRHAIR